MAEFSDPRTLSHIQAADRREASKLTLAAVMAAVMAIFIASLANPWTLGSQPVVISTPDYPWEKVGDLVHGNRGDNPPHVDVNEGPEILKHGNKVILIFSASGCWTDSPTGALGDTTSCRGRRRTMQKPGG